MKKTGTNYDKLSKPELFERGFFSRNPILVRATGLCPLIAIAINAKNALAVAVISGFLLLVNEILASLFIKKFTKWARLPLYFLISGALLIGIHLFLDKFSPNIVPSLGVYLMLLASNSIIVFRCENCAIHSKLSTSIADALANAGGYAVVLIGIGMLREAIGQSSIFGIYIDAFPQASGASMPFFGFIALGFFAAAMIWFRNYFRIGERFDTHEEAVTQDVEKRISDTKSILEPLTPEEIEALKKEATKYEDTSAVVNASDTEGGKIND